MNKRKKLLVLIIVFFGFIFIISGSYALFSYNRTGNSNRLTAGDIYMNFTDNNSISLSNVFPMTKEEARLLNNNIINFTVNGKNTSNKIIYYDINLLEDVITTTSRLWDYDIAFDLGYYNNSNPIYIFEDLSFEELDHTIIHTDSIPANTNSYTRNYFLRAWVSDKVIISDSDGVGAHYRSTSNGSSNLPVYKDCSTKIKIEVSGDLYNDKEIINLYDYISEGAVLDTNVNFANDDSTKYGKYIFSSTQNNENPIYYFRGNNQNNFVRINDTCWRMMRTTDTGGIKLLYYGESEVAYKKEYVSNDAIVSDEVGFSYNSTTGAYTVTISESLNNKSISFSPGKKGNYHLNIKVVTHINETTHNAATFNYTLFMNSILSENAFNGGGGGGENTFNYDQNVSFESESDIFILNFGSISAYSGATVEIEFYLLRDLEVVENEGICKTSGYIMSGSTVNHLRVTDGYSLADISYMYGDNDEFYRGRYYATDLRYYFADDYTYDPIRGSYSLIDSYYTYLYDTPNRYTFFSEEENEEDQHDQLARVLFVDSRKTCNGKSCYDLTYIILKNGESMEEYMDRIFNPVHDSKIKKIIDSWYEKKLINYSNIFEDTVFCNDKTYKFDTKLSSTYVTEMNFRGKNYDAFSDGFDLDLSCPNKRDRYTVSENIGNGKLKYPIALPDIEDVLLSLNSISSFTMTPEKFDYSGGFIRSGLSSSSALAAGGVNPSVSLKHDVFAIKGDGSSHNPFVIQ